MRARRAAPGSRRRHSSPLTASGFPDSAIHSDQKSEKFQEEGPLAAAADAGPTPAPGASRRPQAQGDPGSVRPPASPLPRPPAPPPPLRTDGDAPSRPLNPGQHRPPPELAPPKTRSVVRPLSQPGGDVLWKENDLPGAGRAVGRLQPRGATRGKQEKGDSGPHARLLGLICPTHAAAVGAGRGAAAVLRRRLPRPGRGDAAPTAERGRRPDPKDFSAGRLAPTAPLAAAARAPCGGSGFGRLLLTSRPWLPARLVGAGQPPTDVLRAALKRPPLQNVPASAAVPRVRVHNPGRLGKWRRGGGGACRGAGLVGAGLVGGQSTRPAGGGRGCRTTGCCLSTTWPRVFGASGRPRGSWADEGGSVTRTHQSSASDVPHGDGDSSGAQAPGRTLTHPRGTPFHLQPYFEGTGGGGRAEQ